MAYQEWTNCIEACLKCASICNHCAASCIKEDDVKMMSNCILQTMQCSTICYATAQLMSLENKQAKQLCSLCAEICDACYDECSKHEQRHCQECAEICKYCADQCLSMVS
jgi:hypothetical protein